MSRVALALLLCSTWSGAIPQDGGGLELGQVSPEAADSLEGKIARIIAADEDPLRSPEAREVILASEVELESFVLYRMKDEIPPRVDSIDVTLGAGEIGAATELFFDFESDPDRSMIERLLGGRHDFFVSGALEGKAGEGRFELREVRVDGIPVPLFLVDLLVDRYVTPRYPAVDLDEPFRIPWGIEGIVLSPGRATITY